MAIDPGTTLGPYEIVAPLGKGGMGEVYRARDTRLKRNVAIKLLPEAFTADPERMARFQREAEVLASLEHPNIGSIHGIVDADGTRALVLGLVEGPTLDERIAAGPLPLDEALDVARQIIAALEYAHDHGVVHRDLKPANVKITPEGAVKVLDFGLARVLNEESVLRPQADSPTLTLGYTRAGVVLGTAAYMSPEQAVGKDADRRSDIFAFGCVLYEMLTGHRAFQGDSAPEILAAVAKDDPDWSKLPASTPRTVRDLLRRCLTKDRRERLQAIGEARIALSGRSDDAPVPVISTFARSRFVMAGWIAAAVAVVMAAVAWFLPASADPRLPIHFTVPLPAGGIAPFPLGLSRDGTKLVFSDARTNQLHVRSLDDPRAKPLQGTEGTSFFAVSPDGESVAFQSGEQLKKVSIAGGAALPLFDGASGLPIHWGDDDYIYFYRAPDGLVRIPSSGGDPQIIARQDSGANDLAFLSPQRIQGTNYVLVKVITDAGLANLRVDAIDVRSGERTTVLEGAGDARFANSGSAPGVGHLIYGRSRSLFAAPFDARTLKAGPPAPVVEGLLGVGGLAVFGVSDAGVLAYVTGGTPLVNSLRPVWVTRTGEPQPLAAPARGYERVRLSPDGGRIASGAREVGATIANDIWAYDVERERLNKVTFEDQNFSAVWSVDGRRLIHTSGGLLTGSLALVSSTADSSGEPVSLWKDDLGFIPSSMSPDGILIGSRPAVPGGGVAGTQLATIDVGVDGASVTGTLEPFLDARFVRANPAFSPDGQWVAFESTTQTGVAEIYVVPYPGPGGIVQISNGGGTQPRWRPGGDGNRFELFYRDGDSMMAVDIEVSGSALRPLTPRELFEKASPDYDVAGDGRFLMLEPVPDQASVDQTPELHVIVNWFDELRRRVPLPE